MWASTGYCSAKKLGPTKLTEMLCGSLHSRYSPNSVSTLQDSNACRVGGARSKHARRARLPPAGRTVHVSRSLFAYWTKIALSPRLGRGRARCPRKCHRFWASGPSGFAKCESVTTCGWLGSPNCESVLGLGPPGEPNANPSLLLCGRLVSFGRAPDPLECSCMRTWSRHVWGLG